jgi:hypothetical protein
MFMSNHSPKNPKFIQGLSRRDFLKFCGVGLAGFFLPDSWLASGPQPAPEVERLGRVTLEGFGLYAEPDDESGLVQAMPKDSLWQITGVTVGSDETQVNRIWYELDGAGFAHSGRIQPVRQQLNPVDTTIPEDGCLGEITMPFVDAYVDIEPESRVVYRFYYASTFWVLKRLVDSSGSVWYQLLDDRYYSVFYVPAYYVRLVPSSELSPLSPDVPDEEKSLLVDLSTQSVTAFEGDRTVFMARISSGIRFREGGFATPKGFYRTTRKRPCRHMANGPSAFGSGFDLPGVPWVSYFTSDGVAFHGAYWHNNFGVPHSHGCINMTPQAAKWIYRWTTPTVPPEYYYYSDAHGTRVIVQ